MNDLKNKIIDLATSEHIDFKSNFLYNKPFKYTDKKEEYRWFFWLHELGKELRDIHKLYVFAYPHEPHEDSGKKFVYQIIDNWGLIEESIQLFDSYENAYENGILHSLDFIIQNKKHEENKT